MGALKLTIPERLYVSPGDVSAIAQAVLDAGPGRLPSPEKQLEMNHVMSLNWYWDGLGRMTVPEHW